MAAISFSPIEDTRISGKFAVVGPRKAEVILAYSGNDPSMQHVVFLYENDKPVRRDDPREYVSRSEAYRIAKQFLKDEAQQ